MREFVILQHNKNRLKRWVLIIGSIATTWIVSNYIELTYFAALAPTGIIIVGSVIHHIYNEDYKEIGSFCFTEEGVQIRNFENNSENQLGLNDLKKVIYSYAGYHGEEQPYGLLGWKTTTSFGDSNYIQFETTTKRYRFCFFGNNPGDISNFQKWSENYRAQNIEFKSANYIRYPKFIRNLFGEPSTEINSAV